MIHSTTQLRSAPREVDAPATLAAVLERRACETPDRIAYRQLTRSGVEELTFAKLDQRARAAAATFATHAKPGSRAVLLYRWGLDFVVSFFGCLYGGIVAVPLAPPGARRTDGQLPRLRAVARTTQPRLVLTSERTVTRIRSLVEHCPEFEHATTITPADLAEANPSGGWSPVEFDPSCPAILQFSSGSTGTPRGVVLDHGNVLANLEMIDRRFEQSAQSRLVTWLPVFHDMGLVGGVLQPLLHGLEATLVDPLAFLQRPLCWLEAISDGRATVSGGPNFAYDLCVRRTSPEDRASVDLSSWQVAFVGGEPVRAETLERFATAFAASGFDAEAFFIGYGLAEATLLVTAGRPGRRRNAVALDRQALGRGRVVETDGLPGPARIEVVGNGRPAHGVDVQIVDPSSRRVCRPGRIGEVWVRGPNVARGYWRLPNETVRTFGAHLRTGEESFLRTGDLGFLREGELFVVGRRKDVIIVNGRNIYPQDVERAAETSHPYLVPGRCVAFSDGGERGERVFVVAELTRPAATHLDVGARHEIIAAVRRSVAEEHELHVSDVVLVPPGAVPVTTSGKLRRRTCRSDLLAGRLRRLDA